MVYLYSRFVWKLTAVVRSHGKARDVAQSDILLAIEAQGIVYHKLFVYYVHGFLMLHLSV